MLQCILIDDEPLAIKFLSTYVERIPYLITRAVYTDPVSAMMHIRSGRHVDLIVLDIKMPQLSGIDLAKAVRGKTSKIIFSTSYREFGYPAFDAMGDAFLLKPYSFDKFLRTIEKLFPQHASDEPMLVKTVSGQLLPCKTSEVYVIMRDGAYSCLHLAFSTIGILIDFEEMRSDYNRSNGFVMIDQHTIVAKRYIEEVHSDRVIMTNGKSLFLEPGSRSELVAFLTDQ